MKQLFSHIHILLLILGSMLMASCEDNLFGSQEGFDGKVGLKLALNLPGGSDVATRAGGTGTEPGTGNENLIVKSDIRLLIFQDGLFKEEVGNLKISGGNSTYYLEGVTTNKYEGAIETVILANAGSRGVKPQITAFEGKTIEQVYQQFKFAYSKEAWTVDETNRIPMWGSTKLNVVVGQQNSGNVNMYRAIAKVGFTVNDGKGLDNFQLKSIRVYFSNKEGYCAPMLASIESVDLEKGAEILNPSVPAVSEQWTTADPLVYSVDDNVNVYEDKIYLPEANNKNPGSNRKAVCIVVGGIKTDGEGLVDNGKESFYRIDFKDDLESKDPAKLIAYDILRNHLYRFNILSVTNPGTGTPEDALDKAVAGLEVKIDVQDYTPMRSIPGQYTLSTSTSVISFDNMPASDKMTVKTTYGLDFTDPAAPNGQWAIVEEDKPTWFTVIKDGDNKTITIGVDRNYGVAREGYFYVRAGNLKKQIIVKQEQPPTANSYVVGDGEHELIVIVKGNGNKGLMAEDVQLDTDASLKPAKIGIIWETQKGLVTIPEYTGKPNYDEAKGTIKYKVNTNPASGAAQIGGVSGGNALIGAFDSAENIIWSWHIWVCPDMVNTNEDIKESCVQDWTLNDYKVLDRNLGAIDNKPGVASLGLLYQWGRKDPFIGANKTNDLSPARLNTENYYDRKWLVEKSGSTNTNVPFTIANPTVLTYDGLSTKETVKGKYLWGSSRGLVEGIKDLGSKTIYDPCPKGYRVPPVDAFVFVKKKDEVVSDKYYSVTLYLGESRTLNPPVYVGSNLKTEKFTITGSYWGTTYNITEAHYESKITKSSEDENWNDNLMYIPHSAKSGSYSTNYNGVYVRDGNYYGFYLNYKELKEPQLDLGNWGTLTDGKVYYNLKSNQTDLTWLPLSGAYDPHVNSDGLKFNNVKITQGSSLTVNSFLWTNSSVKSTDGKIRPAAMFLHGAEDHGTSSNGNGRHIHALRGMKDRDDNIMAEPHQAGAVRCVRDEKKDFSESNFLAKGISIGKAAGSTVTTTIKVINEQWKVVDGGDYWLSVSPESGSFDKGAGQDITFKTLETNGSTERSATVLIQFGSEAGPRAIKVTQSNR